MSAERNRVSTAPADLREPEWIPGTQPSNIICSPRARRGRPVRLITLLSAALALGLSACAPEETPTEPAGSASLAGAGTSGYTAVNLGTLGGAFAVARSINAA